MCRPAADGGPSIFSQESPHLSLLTRFLCSHRHVRVPFGAQNCTDPRLAPHTQTLQCVVACMRDRILNGEHDLVGVLLYGTVKHKVPEGQQGFPHIYLVQGLEEPSANAMREVSLICKAEELAGEESAGTSAAVADDFGHMDDAEPLDLANVLWVTSMMFNSAASKNTRRRLCECQMTACCTRGRTRCAPTAALLSDVRPATSREDSLCACLLCLPCRPHDQRRQSVRGQRRDASSGAHSIARLAGRPRMD
jgi:hypothetical protein